MKIYQGHYNFIYDGLSIPKKTPLFTSVGLCIQYMEMKGVNRKNISMTPYADAYIKTIEVLESLPSNILSDYEIEKMYQQIHENL